MMGSLVTGTPRLRVVTVEGVGPRQADEETVVKGPPADRAFDASGAATPWARGLCAQVRAARGRRWRCGRKALRGYVYAAVRREGLAPRSMCWPDALAGLVAGMKIGKTMRWNAVRRRLRPADPLVCLAARRNGHPVRICRVDRGTHNLRDVRRGFT